VDMKVVLLVTWLFGYGAQMPPPYQVEFASVDLCNAAVETIKADVARLEQERVDEVKAAQKKNKSAELSIEEGYQSARLMAINHLAMAKAVLGDLDRITRVIRLLGFVNAAPGFRDAPKVLNGASDLLVAVFGPERGRHARSALYQHELARNAPVPGELTVAERAA
jgi:hypothetical protein